MAKIVRGREPGATPRSKQRRARRATAAVLVATCVVSLGNTAPTAWAYPPGGTHPVAASATGTTSGNANLNGTWTATYVDRPDTTAKVIVQGEDLKTGAFGGTVVPPEGGGALSDGDYDIMDGQVTGDHFSFDIERDGIGKRDATYTADWSGTITDNRLSGNIEATMDPVAPQCDDPADGTRTAAEDDTCLALGGPFTAMRQTYKLGGEITSGCGGQTSCSASGEPFQGMEVDVDGDNGSATTTTDDDGKWSVDLPAGQYTVTPTDDIYNFTPPERDEDLKANLGGQDFTACSLPPGHANLTGVEPARRMENGAASFSLSGEACNEKFTYTYSSAGRGRVKYEWTASALSCEFTIGAKPSDHSLGTFQNVNVKPISFQRTKDANKVITHIVGTSLTNPTPRANPVIDATINPGYQTGVANVKGASQTREVEIDGDSVTCWPPNTGIPLN